MKISIISVLISLLATPCFAQKDTLYFDSLTGNIIVRYVGHFKFVVGEKGARPYDKDEELLQGESVLKRDSIVQVVVEPATKIRPSVTCTSSKKQNSRYYNYYYKVSNGGASEQPLNEFSVDFDATVEVLDATPTDGWHSIRGDDVRGSDLVPGHTWHWFGDIGLEQGNSWIVGALKSYGLPGIVRSYFAGKTQTPVFPGGGPSEEIDQKLNELLRFPSNCIILSTIGPTLPPTMRMALPFVDTLISYKHQALALGWIDNEGVANSLDQKLEAAKKKFAGRDSSAARNILQAFINEVEAQKDKHLSSEAYALLKYNGEYLVDRLGGGHDEEKQKEK